jgi:YHS domain-containing protein
MKRNIHSIALVAALALILVVGVVAQQKSADKAVDPVCGMTVVKADAKAAFDYKGTTYYFCSTGCKDAFAKEPEKYLQAQKAAEEKGQMGEMRHMGQMGGHMAGQAGMMKHEGMAGCPMMRGNMAMGGHMGPMGMRGRGMMAPGMGQLFMLYGDKIEMAVENTKDGAVLKVTSKDPEVVKAIQVHMAEHMAMMKKMKEAPAKAPAAAGVDKMSESACCANCPMTKK